MTDIWDEKPKYDISSQVEHYCFIYYKDEVDVWLEKLKAYYNAIIKLLGADIVAVRTERRKLKDKLEAIKNHWYNEVPPFTMPFLECQDEVVEKYIQDMTKWGDEFMKVLEEE